MRVRRQSNAARLGTRATFTLGYIASVFAAVAAGIYGQARLEAHVAERRADDLAARDPTRRIAAMDYYSLSIREDWPRPVRCEVLVGALNDTGAVRVAARAALARLVRSGDCVALAPALARLATDSVTR